MAKKKVRSPTLKSQTQPYNRLPWLLSCIESNLCIAHPQFNEGLYFDAACRSAKVARVLFCASCHCSTTELNATNSGMRCIQFLVCAFVVKNLRWMMSTVKFDTGELRIVSPVVRGSVTVLLYRSAMLCSSNTDQFPTSRHRVRCIFLMISNFCKTDSALHGLLIRSQIVCGFTRCSPYVVLSTGTGVKEGEQEKSRTGAGRADNTLY